MAIVTWVGQAQATPQQQLLTVTGSTPGTAYGFNGNERQIRYTAVTGDTTTTVAAGIVAAANASSDQRVREMTVSVNAADATKIDVFGRSDGCPITTFGVTTGVSNSNVATPTGPYHADNVLNYSSGALPSNTDTLRFTGLTRNDGPKFALDALSAVTLALVDVAPDYLGSIGLPNQSASGYTEFRTKYFQLKSAAHRILSNGQDYDGRFKINGGAVASNVIASGSGAQSGTYAVHLYNFPTSSDLEASNIGVSTAPESGQTAVFDDDGVTAFNGAVLNLSERTTVGDLLVDASSAFLDCTFDTLTIRGPSAVLSGPNATCATGTGIATEVASGSLDWRSANVPAAEVTIGTDATLTTKNAVGVIPAFILHMYSRSVLDDETGRITRPFTTNLVQCSPTDVTIRLPEHVKAEWDSL